MTLSPEAMVPGAWVGGEDVPEPACCSYVVETLTSHIVIRIPKDEAISLNRIL